MIRPSVRAWSVLFSTLLLAGCESAPVAPLPARFDVAFSVKGDDGEPLGGARVKGGGSVLGTTDEAGQIRTSIQGTEGQTVPVALECPDGFAPPERPELLRLSHTRKVGGERPEPVRHEALCTRKTREVVVVIRAERGQGLPIHVDGKALGVTDFDGNAHVLVRVPRDEGALVVGLDTSARPELRPQHPSRTFDLGGRDTVLVVDSTFAIAQKRAPQRRAAPARHVPYRVD